MKLISEQQAYWISAAKKAVLEYRGKAKLHHDCPVLRRCYVELAAKNRRQSIEWATK